MSTRDESIFKQSLFESLVFYNDCGFIADQFIAQSLDAAKALEKLVRKDKSDDDDDDDDDLRQKRPAILWAVEALKTQAMPFLSALNRLGRFRGVSECIR